MPLRIHGATMGCHEKDMSWTEHKNFRWEDQDGSSRQVAMIHSVRKNACLQLRMIQIATGPYYSKCMAVPQKKTNTGSCHALMDWTLFEKRALWQVKSPDHRDMSEVSEDFSCAVKSCTCSGRSWVSPGACQRFAAANTSEALVCALTLGQFVHWHHMTHAWRMGRKMRTDSYEENTAHAIIRWMTQYNINKCPRNHVAQEGAALSSVNTHLLVAFRTQTIKLN